jgi:YaiO family outer membrane protein
MTGLPPLRRKTAGLIGAFSMLACSAAYAQDTPKPSDLTISPTAVTLEQSTTPPKLLNNYLETGASYDALTGGFGHWDGGYARGVYKIGDHVLNAELNGQHEFSDAGTYVAVGDTFTFNSDWYAALTVGSSVQGFFWPRFRTDGFLSKKWLSRKQWISTVGYGYYDAKDIHRNQYMFLGGTYYFEKPWIVEEGMYFNISNPGTVFAPAGFVAITEGRNKHQYITIRAGLGEEGYQVVGPTVTLSRFQSQTVSITWRKWTGPTWGLNLIADYYHNPFYMRGGSSFGFFKEF